MNLSNPPFHPVFAPLYISAYSVSAKYVAKNTWSKHIVQARAAKALRGEQLVGFCLVEMATLLAERVVTNETLKQTMFSRKTTWSAMQYFNLVSPLQRINLLYRIHSLSMHLQTPLYCNPECDGPIGARATPRIIPSRYSDTQV